MVMLIQEVVRNAGIRKVFKSFFDSILRLLPNEFRLLILEKLPLVVRSSFPDADIRLCHHSLQSYVQRSAEHRKEPYTAEWIRRFFDSGIFYDVGANIGSFSLIAAKLGKVKAVYSFEPSYTTFRTLCENIRVNRLTNRVFPFQFAVGGKTGIETFYYSSLVPGSSFHNLGGKSQYLDSAAKEALTMGLASVTLDDFVCVFKAPKPNYLKIDVDGIELDILRGMHMLLSSEDLRSMCVEYSPDNRKQLVEFLRTYRFELMDDFMEDMEKKISREPRNLFFIKNGGQ